MAANKAPLRVNGEPTEGQLGIGRASCACAADGAAAPHSAIPEHGSPAIVKLLDTLIRAVPKWPSIRSRRHVLMLGRSKAASPNAIAPSATAEVMFRIVGSADEVLRTARTLEPDVTIEEVLRVPMVRLHTIPGVPAAVFPFTTDVPLLDRWGTPLLCGPGSIRVAHTSDEHVRIADLEAAVDRYVSLARACLASLP
jgi:acetylornithine deacetylase